MAATTLVIVGFANAADYGFGTPKAYAVFTAGIVVYVGFGFHIFTTKRVAIIPPVSLHQSTDIDLTSLRGCYVYERLYFFFMARFANQ